MEERQDLISRRVAVDVVDFECGEWRGLAKTIIKKLEALPAVQPDHVADISKKVEGDCISKQMAIDAMKDALDPHIVQFVKAKMAIESLPAQPKYEPVKAEDFAKTMSENTIYSFTVWYGTVLELIRRYGFTICKKTM